MMIFVLGYFIVVHPVCVEDVTKFDSFLIDLTANNLLTAHIYRMNILIGDTDYV